MRQQKNRPRRFLNLALKTYDTSQPSPIPGAGANLLLYSPKYERPQFSPAPPPRSISPLELPHISATFRKALHVTPLPEGAGIHKSASQLFKTRDVSYILDLKTKPDIQHSYSEYPGLAPNSQDLSARKYPQSVTELRGLLPTRGKLADKSAKTFDALADSAQMYLKTNIAKQVPKEFFNFVTGNQDLRGEDGYFETPTVGSTDVEPNKGKGTLGVPASRSDAIALLKWLNSIMEKLESDKEIKTTERLLMVQTVYYICYKEVVRQVSVQCFERGIVIWRIWQAYLSLIEKIREEGKRKIQRKTFKFEAKIHRMHLHYEKEVEDEKLRYLSVAAERDALKSELGSLAAEFSRKKLEGECAEKEFKEGIAVLTLKNSEAEELGRRCDSLIAENVELRNGFVVLRKETAELQSSVSALQAEKARMVEKRRKKIIEKGKVRKYAELGVQASADMEHGEAQCESKKLSETGVQAIEAPVTKALPTKEPETRKKKNRIRPKKEAGAQTEELSEGMREEAVILVSISGGEQEDTAKTAADKLIEDLLRQADMEHQNRKNNNVFVSQENKGGQELEKEDKQTPSEIIPEPESSINVPPPVLANPLPTEDKTLDTGGISKAENNSLSVANLGVVSLLGISKHEENRPEAIKTPCEEELPQLFATGHDEYDKELPTVPAGNNAPPSSQTQFLGNGDNNKPDSGEVPESGVCATRSEELPSSHIESEESVIPSSAAANVPKNRASLPPAAEKLKKNVISKKIPTPDPSEKTSQTPAYNFANKSTAALPAAPLVKDKGDLLSPTGADPVVKSKGTPPPAIISAKEADITINIKPRKPKADPVVIEEMVRKELGKGGVDSAALPETVTKILVDKTHENARLQQELEGIKEKVAALSKVYTGLHSENGNLKERLESIKQRSEAEGSVITELIDTLQKTGVHKDVAKVIEQIKALDSSSPSPTKIARGPNIPPSPHPPVLPKKLPISHPSISAIVVPRRHKPLVSSSNLGTFKPNKDPIITIPSALNNHIALAAQRLGQRKAERRRRGFNIIHKFKQNILGTASVPAAAANTSPSPVSTSSPKKTVQPLPRKTILKLISEIYRELIYFRKSPVAPQPLILSSHVSTELANKYGLKSVSDNKFLQIMESCVEHKEVLRVRMFGRLLGLYEEYSFDELKTYLETLDFLRNANNIGVRCDGNDIDEKQYTPLTRALEWTKLSFESRLSAEELKSFVAKVEEVRVADQKGKNPEGVIEIDRFIELVLAQFAKMSARVSSDIEDLFIAADLGMDGLLTLDEFEVIMAVVEPQAHSSGSSPKLFQEFADVSDNSVEFLSVEKLAAVSMKAGLFSPAAQARFLGKDFAGDFSSEVGLVRNVIPAMKAAFLERLRRSRSTGMEVWGIRLNELEKRLGIEGYSMRSIWMAYKLVAEYTALALRRAELDRLFGPELLKIAAIDYISL